MHWLKLKWENKINFIWEIWTQKEIGVMQEIMLRQCENFTTEKTETLLLQLKTIQYQTIYKLCGKKIKYENKMAGKRYK